MYIANEWAGMSLLTIQLDERSLSADLLMSCRRRSGFLDVLWRLTIPALTAVSAAGQVYPVELPELETALS